GARFGPAHVRQSSRLLRPYNPATGTSPFAQVQVADAGDMAINPFNIDEAISTIEQDALALTEDGASILTVGGDHTIALPLLRAASKRAGEPVALLHFDAHLDTWDTYFGGGGAHGGACGGGAGEGGMGAGGGGQGGGRGAVGGKEEVEGGEAVGGGVGGGGGVVGGGGEEG